MSAWGSPRTSKINKSWNTTTRQMQNSNVIMNWGESETVAILRSSDSRGRHPRRAPPWIGHAIRHVCEWTHCKWMAGLCWGARFISSNKNAPTGRHLLPLVGGAWSPAGVSHVRESGWMSCVCLAVRVTGCVRVQVRTHAETAGRRRKKKKQHKCNTWREAKLTLKASGTKFCLWTRLILPEKEDERGKMFLFWIIVKLVLIDTGRCYGQVWRSSALQ